LVFADLSADRQAHWQTQKNQKSYFLPTLEADNEVKKYDQI
jgi:hypothetical protein